MAYLDEEMLKKQMKSGELSGVYLIHGDEPYLKKLYAEKLISATVTPDFQDFNLHRFEKEASVESIVSACEALPMLSDHTCIVVRDMSPDELNEADFNTLYDAVADMPETTRFVFWFDTLAVSSKPTSRVSKFIKLFAQRGSVVELKKRTGNSLLKPIVAGAQKRGCRMEMSVASYLVSIVGDNYNTLLNELEKLCNYVSQGEITKQTVDTICIKSLEASAFDLAKALVAGNIESAFKTLDNLFVRKVEPSLIMGAIISAYVDMYRAKISVTCGFKAEHLAGAFNYRNKEFRLRNGARDASRLSVDQLRRCLNELSAADLTLKTEYSDATGGRLAVEKVIVKLLLICNE